MCGWFNSLMLYYDLIIHIIHTMKKVFHIFVPTMYNFLCAFNSYYDESCEIIFIINIKRSDLKTL